MSAPGGKQTYVKRKSSRGLRWCGGVAVEVVEVEIEGPGPKERPRKIEREASDEQSMWPSPSK